MMIVRLALLLVLVVGEQGLARAAGPTLRVHLLGTGGPELVPDRSGYATLIEAPGLADDAGG